MDLRAEWPLQGIQSEKVASGRCSPISTNHVALFVLSCTCLGLVSTLHLALAIFQQGAPCFGHCPIFFVKLKPYSTRTDTYRRSCLSDIKKREIPPHPKHLSFKKHCFSYRNPMHLRAAAINTNGDISGMPSMQPTEHPRTSPPESRVPEHMPLYPPYVRLP